MTSDDLVGIQRLRDGLRKLRDDPTEAARIEKLLAQDDEISAHYAAGNAARKRGDFTLAEWHMRQLLKLGGHPEAAYWLARLLQLRSFQLQLEQRFPEAEALDCEALSLLLYATVAGVFETV